MRVAELISNVKELTNQMVSDGVLLDYVNQIESEIFTDTIEEYRTKWIECKKGEDIILPSFKFEIQELEIFKNKEGRSLDIVKWVDGDYDIFSDTDNQSNGYAIKNKWGKCWAKIIYRYVPERKKLENIHSDTLDILRYGDRFYGIYEHHLKHKLFLAVEEYQQANNEAVMFNDELSKLKKYALDHRYNKVIKKVEGKWR